MAPQLYGGKVLVSTVPGSGIKRFYEPGSVGVVYSLDAATGKTIWSFNTVPKPTKGSFSGGDSAVYILIVAKRDFGDGLLGRRVDDDRRRRSGRLPPFSVDVEFAEEAGFRQVSNGRGHWKRSLMR